MRICVFILALFFIYSTNFAQDGLPTSRKSKEPTSFLEVPNILKTRIDNFFTSLINDDVNGAYDKMLTNSPISRQKNDVDNLLKQTKRAFEIYGNIGDRKSVV